MKSTETFKNVIVEKLNEIASKDPLFAQKLQNDNKNIDDCISYILNSVKNSGCNGFADDEIFGMAMHYYDEDNIEVGEPINCQVVVNHAVELTQEEVKEAKEKALERVISEEKDRLRKKAAKKHEEKGNVEQGSLF